MARDSGGNYSSPSAPFVNGTIADADEVNEKLQDIGDELTDSLSRSGKGGMLARLRGIDGTAASPAYSFTDETDLGFYRGGTSDLRVANGGVDLFKWTATENRSLQALKITTGGLTVDAGGATITAGGVTVTAGGATITAGGLTITAGGATVGGGANITGASNATGANITAGAGNAAGAVIVGTGTGVGAQVTAGTAATGATPRNAAELTNGNLKLSGTAPNSDAALSNTITPSNIPKAVAHIVTTTSNTQSVEFGFNIASVATVGSAPNRDVRVTMATAMASTNYAVLITGSDAGFTVTALSRTTTTFDINLSGIDLGNKSADIYVAVFGAQ